MSDLPAEGRAQLEQALALWAAGDHYEAHELLEDVAEHFAETDPSFEIALALVHMAASAHKLIHDVGASAVPGKIDRAMEVLSSAPAEWHGLDLAAFVSEMKAFRASLDAGAPGPFPELRMAR